MRKPHDCRPRNKLQRQSVRTRASIHRPAADVGTSQICPIRSHTVSYSCELRSVRFLTMDTRPHFRILPSPSSATHVAAPEDVQRLQEDQHDGADPHHPPGIAPQRVRAAQEGREPQQEESVEAEIHLRRRHAAARFQAIASTARGLSKLTCATHGSGKPRVAQVSLSTSCAVEAITGSYTGLLQWGRPSRACALFIRTRGTCTVRMDGAHTRGNPGK